MVMTCVVALRTWVTGFATRNYGGLFWWGARRETESPTPRTIGSPPKEEPLYLLHTVDFDPGRSFVIEACGRP